MDHYKQITLGSKWERNGSTFEVRGFFGHPQAPTVMGVQDGEPMSLSPESLVTAYSRA